MKVDQLIHLPPNAAKYISLQRLETQALGKSIHYNKLGYLAYKIYCGIPFAKHIYRHYSTHVEPLFRSKEIIEKYTEIMVREFETIRNYLGPTVSTVLSIGPGVGGLEVMLTRHLISMGQSPPHLILCDKSGIEPIHFGYTERAAAYNSLELSKQALVDNGQPVEKIETIEASLSRKLLDSYTGKVDIVISLLAWGFHFPIQTYLELAKRLLKPTGRIILDTRKETPGFDEMVSNFECVKVIHDDPKFERLLATKPS
ncbi:MAG: hypothetical protein F4149_17485 [Gammaproteobacteria bacterium]|nr:hypothetical protein [Gammaproteobacteria bacterium]